MSNHNHQHTHHDPYMEAQFRFQANHIRQKFSSSSRDNTHLTEQFIYAITTIANNIVVTCMTLYTPSGQIWLGVNWEKSIHKHNGLVIIILRRWLIDDRDSVKVLSNEGVIILKLAYAHKQE